MTMTSKSLFAMLMLDQAEANKNSPEIAKQLLEKIHQTLRNHSTGTLSRNAAFIQNLLEHVLERLIQQLFASKRPEFDDFKSAYAKLDLNIIATDLFKSLSAHLLDLLKILSGSILKYMHLLNEEEYLLFETEKINLIAMQIASYLFKDIENNDTLAMQTEKLNQLIHEALRNDQMNQQLLDVIGDQNDIRGEKVARCILLGADADTRLHGIVPLQKAAAFNCYAQAEILLQQGALPNRKSQTGKWQGWAAAHSAAYCCSPGMFEVLLKYRTNFQLPIEANNKFYGHHAITLLLCLPQYNRQSFTSGRIYRCLAKLYRDLDENKFRDIINTPVADHHALQALFSSNWQGWTVLALAVLNWRHKMNSNRLRNIIELLVDAGADPNQYLQGRMNAWRGFNPLHVLAYNKYKLPRHFRLDVYRALIRAGGDIHLPTAMNAVWGWRNLSVLEIEARNHDALTAEITLMAAQFSTR